MVILIYVNAQQILNANSAPTKVKKIIYVKVAIQKKVFIQNMKIKIMYFLIVLMKKLYYANLIIILIIQNIFVQKMIIVLMPFF